jgi:hypothetical protein
MGTRNLVDWNDKRLEGLRQGVADGKTFREIGQDIGCSRNAAIGKAKRLGLVSEVPAHRPRTRQQVEQGKSQVMKINRHAAHRALVVANGGTTLARTSMDERQGGMGVFKQVAAVEIALDRAEIRTRPVSLLDRTSDQCCWPLDGGTFCGMPKCTPEYGKTEYCGPHHKLSVRPHSEYRKPLRRRT